MAARDGAAARRGTHIGEVAGAMRAGVKEEAVEAGERAKADIVTGDGGVGVNLERD